MNPYVKFFFILIFFNNTTYAQLSITELLQSSKINTEKEHTLFLVDFWATWCGPCVYAKTHLTTLQKQFPKSLYIISISEETKNKVQIFLEKKPTDLAIGIDTKGGIFKQFNIRQLPNAILFNSEGEILWRGHPSDLKSNMISQFLNKTKKVSSFDRFMVQKKKTLLKNTEYIPKTAVEIHKIQKQETLLVEENDKFLKIEGSLIDIFSLLAKVNNHQLELQVEEDNYYRIYFTKPFSKQSSLYEALLKKMNFVVEEYKTRGEAFILEPKNRNYWDTYQIDWGGKDHFLISDTEIIADDVSLIELAYELSVVLQTPVIIKSDNEKELEKRDWQIHYKYYEFMKNNFSNYGISIEKKNLEYPLYIIKKKTS